MVRKSIISLTFLGSIALVNAQEGILNIEQDSKIEALTKVYNKVKSTQGYYQIQVGFGNHAKAQKLKSQIEIDFPGWESKIEFKEPTYRVRLGKFKDPLEAERKFKEVRKKYPASMLLRPE